MSALQAITATAAIIGSYVPPQNVFPTPGESTVVPRWAMAAGQPKLLKSAAKYDDNFFKMRQADSCYYPLEVLVIQDSTYSFSDDFPVMINSELDEMFDGITQTHPGSTFAVATHTDKPIKNFGWPADGYYTADWCWRMEQSLSGSKADLKSTYERFYATGGYDIPENQFGALVNACQSKKLGWGTTPDAARLIVIVTDSPPHYDGDGNDKQSMVPFSGTFDEDHADEQCVNEFYPTPQQAIDTVLDTSSGQIPPYVAFVVFDGADLPNNQTIGSWRWFAESIKEDDRFVRDRTANSDNFWEELSQVIGVIDSIECTATSTVAPTSTTIHDVTTTTESTVTTTEEPTTTIYYDTFPTDTTTTESTTPETTTEPITTETTRTEEPTTTIYYDTFPTDTTTNTEPTTTQTASTELTTDTSATTMTTPTVITGTTTPTTPAVTTAAPCPCPCPQPCPEPCACKCGDSVYLRHPKNAKSVDLHIDYKRV